MARHAEFDRTKIVEQAMNLFWEKGYEATSVQDLTEVMGIKPGSLYNSFQDKHTLFLEALDRYRATDGSYLLHALAESTSGKAAIEMFFRGLIEELISDPQNRACFILNATLELGSHDPEVAERVRESTQFAEEAFRLALDRAKAAGEIGQQYDVQAIAAYLVSMVKGIQVTAKAQPNRESLLAIMQLGLSILN
jgi:TetR/AcrR family transcriptional repressor of nem operon